MGMRGRAGGLAVALVVALTAAGCFGPASSSSSREAAAPPLPRPAAVIPPPVEHVTYAVGARILHLERGGDRPLPTLVFYPVAAKTPPTGETALAGVWDIGAAAKRSPGERVFGARVFGARASGARASGARVAGARGKPAKKRVKVVQGKLRWKARPPAEGRFPLVLFCHGLSGSPERYADALAAWAAAGFVVAAPTFPHTSEFTDDFRRPDIVNQPADARYVLARVRALDLTPGDPLWHRIDTDHIAVVGHSAGGYTTTGLLNAGHDPRLRAGVIMAGWAAKGAFAGPPATMLFLQGTSDPIVRVAASRRLFARVPWPKSYLLMQHNSHATYLRPGDSGYDLMRYSVTAFLRWTLEGDESGRRSLPRTVYPAGLTVN
ncbi:alpha/beta hydrolase family protein [Actinoplanes sp. NPDC051513]|uniref:alpha/beta hydrolase family protein n=1 Tax=Actinoplanes sp. NPDC051513 TaxID=3363908 RepID=UPI0037BDDBE1